MIMLTGPGLPIKNKIINSKLNLSLCLLLGVLSARPASDESLGLYLKVFYLYKIL